MQTVHSTVPDIGFALITVIAATQTRKNHDLYSTHIINYLSVCISRFSQHLQRYIHYGLRFKEIGVSTLWPRGENSDLDGLTKRCEQGLMGFLWENGAQGGIQRQKA